MKGCIVPAPRASAVRFCAAIRLINSSLSAVAPDPSMSVFIIQKVGEYRRGVSGTSGVNGTSRVRLAVQERVIVGGSTVCCGYVK